jgi:hypothetical protein
MFSRKTRPPYSGQKSKPWKQPAEASNKASCLAYFSTLKMETAHYFETSGNSCRTMWHLIPEDSAPQGILRTCFGINSKTLNLKTMMISFEMKLLLLLLLLLLLWKNYHKTNRNSETVIMQGFQHSIIYPSTQ